MIDLIWSSCGMSSAKRSSQAKKNEEGASQPESSKWVKRSRPQVVGIEEGSPDRAEDFISSSILPSVYSGISGIPRTVLCISLVAS